MNHADLPAHSTTGDGIEIERKYLLNGMPQLPAGTVVLQIEQGYFPQDAASGRMQGRLRRTTMPDGSVECTHTIKTGVGLQKREVERPISEMEFAQHWPGTAGRRLRKRRHRVPDGDLVWEVDEFQELGLMLAEVELPSVDVDPPIPRWLESVLIREVTDDPAYTNASIALRAGNGADAAQNQK